MDTKRFNEMVEFFKSETGCVELRARMMAACVDNIVFNAKRDDEDFIMLVAFGIRNGYFAGQESH